MPDLTFNAANQITTTWYTYDGAGNRTADPNGTYTFNGAEQMTQSVVAGVTSTYTYAGASQNEVLSETTSAGRTYKITYGLASPQGQPVIEQYSVNGNVAYVENDPGTGQPVIVRTASATPTRRWRVSSRHRAERQLDRRIAPERPGTVTHALPESRGCVESFSSVL